MRQSRKINVKVGGVLDINYVFIFQHNHAQIIRNSIMIYEGDEQRGYKWLDAEIEKDRKIAEDLGLSYVVTG